MSLERRQCLVFVLAGVILLAWMGRRLSTPLPPDANAWMVIAAGPSAPLLTAASSGSAPESHPAPSDPALGVLPPVVIPPQCWTKTRDESGKVHNPCFVCHVRGTEPNYTDDSDLQTRYDFARGDRKNPYTNLFVDRTSEISKISDDDILRWVRETNYPPRLPSTFGGYRPDAAFSFDDRGFDRRPDGAYTGWRAYAYMPLPGFFATNGSMGDALIRLPEAYRQSAEGDFDRVVYETNLAIVEALIRRSDVAIPSTPEAKLGIDLDGDGRLGEAHIVKFVHAPRTGQTMRWAGRAALLHQSGEAPIAPGLFPLGTELLHSVRYLDVSESVVLAARMKELRYSRKTSWLTYAELQQRAREEELEKLKHRDRARVVMPAGVDADRGVSNGRGWRYQAFIEDARGALRPQTFRETAACAGCHGGIGATTDGTFSFARKLSTSAYRGGWFHPSQMSLAGVAEPRRADGSWEYTHYLEKNGAADDARANDEVTARFFDEHGLVPGEVAKLHRDVTRLLLPSPGRALALAKAYLVIVREQSFERGRDATIRPATTVHQDAPEDDATGIDEPIASVRIPSTKQHRNTNSAPLSDR